MKKVYQLETLSCPTCANKIEGMLKKVKGISGADVAFMASKVKVEFDDAIITSDQIKERIARFGYDVIGEK